MENKLIVGVACTGLAIVSFNVSATVLNTINGVNYEWLELSVTQGISRDQVDVQLNDVNSALYGYEYASRSLTEDLLLSYSYWGGPGGHTDPVIVNGLASFLDDFDTLRIEATDGITNTFVSADDGSTVVTDGFWLSDFLYGQSLECGGILFTCRGQSVVHLGLDGLPAFGPQGQELGWDSQWSFPARVSFDYIDPTSSTGSLLVRVDVSSVPVPAAAWLFGSGLVGLIVLARRKV